MANKRRKLKPRFYVVCAALVACVAFLVWTFFPGKPHSVDQGKIEYSDSFNSVVIRDETIYQEENFGKITMLVGEGKKVAKDAKIAEVYQWDYSDRITAELTDIQTKISDYQEQNVLKNIVNKDLETVRGKINDKIAEIKAVVDGTSTADTLKLEEQLKGLKNEEQTLIKAISPTTDATLNEMYALEKSILDRIDKSKRDVLASEAGVVSFYFDGAEETLKPENIDNFTKADVENILAGKLPTTNNQLDGKKSLYRLIDNYKWYIVFLGPKDGVRELVVDQKYEITFEGIYDQPYNGKLISSRNVDGATLYAFEFEEDVSPLISVRSAKIKINKTFEGYKIPSSAIKEQNGIKGVYVDMSYGKTFVKVNVVVDDGRHAIVEFIDTKMEEDIRIYES